jgi:replicative superfamily II helicase
MSPPARIIQPSPHKELQDPVLNAVVALANETVRAGYGVLIFCSSRSGCESDARMVARVLPDIQDVDPEVAEKREDLLGDLRSLPSGIDPVLADTIPSGVAFHRKVLPGDLHNVYG